MRIARAPSANEGMTALHTAAQAGRADLVRYLLDKGANPELADSSGHKPIDLVASGAGGRGAAAPAAAAGGAAGPAAGAGSGATGVSPAAVAEIRGLLQSAGSKK